jgi:hypothetical protein
MRGAAAALLLIMLVVCPVLAQSPAPVRVHGSVTDSSHLPLPGVTITLSPVRPASGTSPSVAMTDGIGQYQFDVPPGLYTLTAELAGFEKAIRREIVVGTDPLVVDLELALAAFTEETQVVAQVPKLMSSSEPLAPATVDKDVIKIAPVQGLRYDSALPLLPNTVRGPDGLISMGGARASQGTVLVDRMRESDPVSGEPAIAVPIAAIDTVQVFAPTPPADAGPATSGVMLVNSRRGADAYGLSIASFFPRPRFGGGAGLVNGIEAWNPNAGVSGPIARGRAWFAESIEYRWERFQHETTLGRQDTTQKGYASFSRLDVKAGNNYLIAARVAVNPEDRKHVGLSAFAPASAVPSQASRAWSGALATHIVAGSGAIDLAVHVKHRGLNLFPDGAGPYAVGHDLVHGGYFRTMNRDADRTEGSAVWSRAHAGWHGGHVFKAGLAFSRATATGQRTSRPVDYLRSDGTTAWRIEFIGTGQFDAADSEAGLFVQDSWTPRAGLSIDVGARWDYAGVVADHAFWPRAAVSYSLDDRTKVSAGGGVFAEKPTLNVAIYEQRQSRQVQGFDSAGQPAGAPQTFTNQTGALALPHAAVLHVQVDRILGRDWTIRAGYQERRSMAEPIVNPIRAAGGESLLLLDESGESRARSVEVTAGYRSPSAARQFYLSYVRSSSIGNLNDITTMTGILAEALILPDSRGPLTADVPHRLLAWGIIALPWRLTFAPFLEIRSGFPYSPIDDEWQPVGPRNSGRFPVFASLDFALEKALKVRKVPPMRLGLKCFNVTGRTNGRDIQADVARADYGRVLNPIYRQFRASLEFVWNK